MTGQVGFSNHFAQTLEKLAWGWADGRQRLVERGWWPQRAQPVLGADGQIWQLLGAKLYQDARSGARAAKPQGWLVPESDCLWGSLTLPELPRQALQAAVQEAMWRVSPLPLDQAWCGWQAQPQAEGGWAVQWGICRSGPQQQAQARRGLPQAASLPVYLQRQGRVLPVPNPAYAPAQQRQRWGQWLAGLGVLALLLALAAPALLPLALKRQAVTQALGHVSALEPVAAPLREQLEALRGHAEMADNLQQGAASGLPLARVVEALADQLPDDTVLDRIEISSLDVRISGTTDNAASLISHLTRQPQWQDVRAHGASVRDASTGKERFTFDLHWQPPVPPQPAPTPGSTAEPEPAASATSPVTKEATQ